MRIAAWQGNAAALDVEGNVELIAQAAKDAAERNADVLVTPELFVTGYAPARVASEVTEQQLVWAREQLAEIARRHHIAVVASLPGEKLGDRRPITAVLWNADGDEVLVHNKVHLFGPDERDAFASASKAPGVAKIGEVNVALLICYDVEFPESVRAAADHGADVVLVPTALTEGYEGVQRALIPARALENHVVVAYVNHTGVEDGLQMSGHSVIAGPTGTVLAEAGEQPELIVADVDTSTFDAIRADVPYLNDRRPGLYREWQLAAEPSSN